MLTLARSSFFGLTSKNARGIRTFTSWHRKCPKFFKSSSICVVRDCRAQIEFVIAYRVRRGLQLLVLYSKLGEEYALWRCFLLVRRYFIRFSKASFLSLSAAAFKFNWSEERIRDDDIARHYNDVELCHRLKEEAGKNETPCNEKIPNDSSAFKRFLMSEKCWVPFVTMENLTIWKKQTTDQQSQTLCCYKVYGYFNDVNALTFLRAYLDLATRKTWDQHVLKLEVVESEPESNSDLIYWISKWPKMFANRDYVYKRRYVVDDKKQLIAVASQAARHPEFPPTKNNLRVENYWSYLIIKPFRSFKEKGLEFSLTYFDDPGSNLPGSMLIWATVHGMPSYFNRLHLETLKIESNDLLVDFPLDSPDEADPFEGYWNGSEVSRQAICNDATSLRRTTSLANVPFPLPPPSDPNKPKILPRRLSQDEFIRSFNQIKFIIKESVEKMTERYQSIDESSEESTVEREPPPSSNEHSGHSHSNLSSMFSDPFFGTYIIKAAEFTKPSNFCLNARDTDAPLVTVLSHRFAIIEALIALKRVAWKVLFDRIWR